jgi:S-layer family protein
MRKHWISLACAGILMAAAPVVADDNTKPGCGKSPLAEPDWYLEECLGGVPPTTATEALDSPLGGPLVLSYIHNVRNAGTFPLSVVTAPVGTLSYTLLGPNTRPIFALDFNNGYSALWGIDNTTRELGFYNQTNGAFTAIGVVTGIPASETVSGLKFDPTSTSVYVSTTDGVVSNLYTLSLNTRVATLVGPIGFSLVIDIAISNTGQMYGHDIGLDQLISINKATGAGTIIGPTGFNANFAQGMDFDNGTNVLWAWLYIGGGVNNLVTFNLNTWAATLVLAGPPGPENEGAIKMLLAPGGLTVDTVGNSVAQPGETVIVAPYWRNVSPAGIGATGTISNFAGPAGGTYTINDAAASYGTIPANTNAFCTTDCYAVTALATTRPIQHWDTTVLETTNPAQTKTWTIHIGDSFTDLPASNPFYRFVETIFHKGITGGCGTGIYCPSNSTTREQMAVFALISKEGAGYTPPACVAPNLFSDVPETSPFCRYIEELASRGVVSGCGPNLYCPSNPVTREQMSIFMLKTLDPALNPPACSPPNLFADVPETSPFCRWIEELANRGVVSGCGGGNYCPSLPVTREQMGVFLTQTFLLSLYGL